jgi:hypothetical protein
VTHVHSWRTTTADNYRACETCPVAWRLVDGQWREMQPRSVRKSRVVASGKKVFAGMYANNRKALNDLRGYWS